MPGSFLILQSAWQGMPDDVGWRSDDVKGPMQLPLLKHYLRDSETRDPRIPVTSGVGMSDDVGWRSDDVIGPMQLP